MSSYSRTFTPVTGTLFRSTNGAPIIGSLTKQVGQESVVLSNDSGNFITINAFEQVRNRVTGGLFNGSWEIPAGISSYQNYPSNAYDQRTYQGWPSSGPLGVYAAQLLANTNPTRADLGIPVFLAELRDIPGMIKHAGYLLLLLKKAIKRLPPSGLKPDKEAAAAFLAYNFGWAPLVSDLKKMINVSDLHSKRAKEFERLYNGTGLKRRQTLDKIETSEQTRTFAHHSYAGGSSVMRGNSSLLAWGVAKWKPSRNVANDPLSKPTPMAIRRMVLGLSYSNITANIWEALPWSWLTDYFINFGDLIVANQGRHIATPSPAAIMVESSTKLYAAGVFIPKDTNGGGVHLGDSSLIHVKKLRSVSYPTLEASFAQLGAKQLSILGSLAALRVIPKLTR